MGTDGAAAERLNVATYVLERTRAAPDAPAMHVPLGRGRWATITNCELDASSDEIAAGLVAAGIGRGVRTALMVRPSRELFALTLALFKAGAVPVMVDPGIGVRRIARCLEEAEPEAFVGVPAAHAARLALGWGRRTLRTLVTVGRRFGWGGTTLAALRARGRAAGGFAPAPTRAGELAAILFTSGSTGPPKGVEYRHENFAAQVEAIRALAEIAPGEIDLASFPLFALFDPALGMCAVVPEMDATRPGAADPRKLIAAAERFGATNLFGSPALLETVGRFGEARGARFSTLRRVVSAGAPVPAETMRRFLALLPEGARVYTPYGATECLPVACITSDEVLGETAAQTAEGAGVCVGTPVPSVTCRILRTEDGAIEKYDPALELPPGEIGEIVVRAPQATRAYVSRPEETALAKITDPNGGFWHRMGDLGYLDERGRLWFCGRKSERVITQHGTLYSVPCEAPFETHPAVRRAALVGVPAGAAMLPVLCVELLPAHRRAPRDRLREELRAIGERHAHTRRIEDFLFHRGFPVDVRHNAKIDRAALARWAIEQP